MTHEEALKLKNIIPEKEIFGILKTGITMRVWNGKCPVEDNMAYHIAPTGTKVRLWMASRLGDVGITDNLIDPVGYDARIDPEQVNLCDG